MQLAVKTKQAITDAIVADGGSAFRQLLGKVLPHIGDAYRAEEFPFRSHLGASLIGGECDRALWFQWRWAWRKTPKGRDSEPDDVGHARILRLFNRGHLEEGRFIALLLAANVQVFQQDADGNQYRVSFFGGHFGGSGDGVLVNCPDLPHGEPCLGEFKTHGDKSFQKLVAHGVRVAKWTHYVQMQVYMEGMGLRYALYVAVNKNDDDLHMEIVEYNPAVSRQYINRAGNIISSNVAPPKVRNAKPTFYICKQCDFSEVCYRTHRPLENCRTCRFVYFHDDGKVYCNYDKTNPQARDKHQQLEGCMMYTVTPAME